MKIVSTDGERKEETWILAYLKFAGATTSMLPRLGWLWGEAPEIIARQHTSTQLCAGTGQARLLIILSVPPGALMYSLATTDHTYSLPHAALDWQSLPERLCSRTPASTVLYRTGHSVMNYSFAVVLCVSESVKDIFRLHACRQGSSLFPHLLITTWPSTTADYG
ncbi:hypothetical protein J6590_089509 [Homalodisca vitripennis]|nr:hypothetical protein J6590_089509 [Homalodisca vitripennis]